MRLIRGKVARRREFPWNTGWIWDLYRTAGVPEPMSQNLETKFMTPLDTKASRALVKLKSQKVLTRADRIVWAQFLLSLLYRNRECVDLIKTHMAEIHSEATLAREPEWAAQRGPLDERTFAEATAARKPNAADISASNMVADIIANSRAVPDIASMHFACIDVRKSKTPLLTSDRPLVATPLSHPQANWALSIGPHHLFVAAFDAQLIAKLLRVDVTKLVMQMNRDVVSQARALVWGVDDGELDFVQTWIGSSPDRVILTEAQRQDILAIGRGLQATP